MELPNLIYIKELADGSTAFEEKILGIVKREFPQEKAAFLLDYDAENYIQAAAHVHKLKNKIGMFGLEGGYQTAVAFETELKQSAPTLDTQFKLILATMESFLETL